MSSVDIVKGFSLGGTSLCEAHGTGANYLQPSGAQQPLVELKGRKDMINSMCSDN